MRARSGAMRGAAALLLVAAVLAGCATNEARPQAGDDAAPDGPVPDGAASAAAAPGRPPVGANGTDWSAVAGPDATCAPCFEPTLASDGTYLYATGGNHEALLRSRNGTWEALRPAPPPDPGAAQEGDIYVQVDPQGRLWWHGLMGDRPESRRIHVARSDDQGLTWAVNHALTWGPAGQGLGGAADRNWLAADGDRVMVLCTCPVVALPQVRTSEDGGASFGPAAPILEGYGRPGPIGPIALGPGGRALAPFLVGVGPMAQVAAVVTDDWGATWTRVDVTAPGELATRGGTVCCAFPNSAGSGHGFLVAFAAANGDVMVSRSADGDAWTTEEVGSGAVYPHPAPVWIGDQAGVAWHASGGGIHVLADGTSLEVGDSSGGPGDYVAATLHAGHLLAAWPSPDGIGVGGVALADPPADPGP